ncbi:uncharacterized protein SPAPADRAFT_63126 [Spathaspora passalidarum NRRL Y-27907]|uniref:Uncharacterized protein n=1 Tax=Spathaspora passalidarum (strain NRRL Y-27907 / 11-Y1) TaxID=619300 RepID=G3ATQ3_SPAPN|nr:uncharacterized protein SPAPADRAFT_63126 [Spathaspora passalidarum NRRL Y-27907]EGW30279.1 hypothetical protein SPAPADRAFT_63126 [Spathaspora passalidarum NRRL Y-27907]
MPLNIRGRKIEKSIPYAGFSDMEHYGDIYIIGAIVFVTSQHRFKPGWKLRRYVYIRSLFPGICRVYIRGTSTRRSCYA